MAYSRRSFAAYPKGGIPVVVSNMKPWLRTNRTKVIIALLCITFCCATLVTYGGSAGRDGESFFLKSGRTGRQLKIATWNIAAINNNPFEYWITYKENPQYEELMVNVENFLEAPGDRDVPVHEVFTEEMFQELDQRLTQVGWISMQTYWDEQFKNRKIVEGFLKDKSLGDKRLASMPDRITNTINVKGGDQAFRPTVINMYEGDLSTMQKWWKAWERFMFDDKLSIERKDSPMAPYSMLKSISKEKYKQVTEQEEKDSLPLQTLCGAIFDAILVHMMNTVSGPDDDWQELKKIMVKNLNKQKIPHTISILKSSTYTSMDIITLQEVSGSFIQQVTKSLGKTFHVIAPADMDAVRDQNSVILLKKSTFPRGVTEEFTQKVVEIFPPSKVDMIAEGDLLAITTMDKYGTPYIVASFHGDTNGLATKPILDALMETISTEQNKELEHSRLIFGLDANVYENASSKQQGVLDFGERYRQLGLTSCWGDVPQPSNYTTYNARTYLQPQLNKACKKSDKRQKGDVNPKDFILFKDDQLQVVHTWKDNTGKKLYIEDMAFPTLDFPSDHGILATVLQPVVSTS